MYKNWLILTTLLLRLLTDLLVALHALEELLPALRVTNVLNADVHSLFDIAIPDHLIHNDTNSMGSDIVDNARSPVVELVRHTLLLGSVRLDVNDIADPVVKKERRKLDGTMFCLKMSSLNR